MIVTWDYNSLAFLEALSLLCFITVCPRNANRKENCNPNMSGLEVTNNLISRPNIVTAH